MAAYVAVLTPLASAMGAEPAGGACPPDAAFTDASGDANLLLGRPTPVPSIEALDIVAARLVTDPVPPAQSLSFLVKVNDLTPPLAYDQSVRFLFTVAGQEFFVEGRRSPDGTASYDYGEVRGGTVRLALISGSFNDTTDEITLVLPFTTAKPAFSEGTTLNELAINSAPMPRNVPGRFVVDVAYGECPFEIDSAQWEDQPPPRADEARIPEARGAPVPPGVGVRYVEPVFQDVTLTRGIPFGAAVDNQGRLQQLQLDLYWPTGDQTSARPAVIFAHGGGFINGARDDEAHAAYLLGFARRGYVVMSIDYRLRPPGTPGYEPAAGKVANLAIGTDPSIADAQHDMQAAVRWTRANAVALGVDPDKIIVTGSSAGAITAWQAAINPSDPGQSGTPDEPSNVAAAVSLWGAADTDNVESGNPPVIALHGVRDDVVPLPLAASPCTAGVALGNICELVLLPEGGHPAWDQIDVIFPEVTGFLCRRVLEECDADAPQTPVRIAGEG